MTCSQTPAPALVTPWVIPSAGCPLTLRHKAEVSAQLCPDTTQHAASKALAITSNILTTLWEPGREKRSEHTDHLVRQPVALHIPNLWKKN